MTIADVRSSEAGNAFRGQLPLDLGKGAISIYLWRAVGFLLNALFFFWGIGIGLISWHAARTPRAGGLEIFFVVLTWLSFLLTGFGIGAWLKRNEKVIPSEVHFALLPTKIIYLTIAALAALALVPLSIMTGIHVGS